MDSQNMYNGYDPHIASETEEKYCKAVTLYKKEGFRNLAKARRLFREIGPYKDSTEYLNYCEILYEEAEQPHKAKQISKWIRTVIEVLLHLANMILWTVMYFTYVNQDEDGGLIFFMGGVAVFSLLKVLFNIITMLPPIDDLEEEIPLINLVGKGNWAVQTFVRLLLQFIITVVCVAVIFAVGMTISIIWY